MNATKPEPNVEQRSEKKNIDKDVLDLSLIVSNLTKNESPEVREKFKALLLKKVNITPCPTTTAAKAVAMETTVRN